MPIVTLVAVMTPDELDPNTATCSPTVTSAMVGEVTSRSTYVVVELT